MDWEAWIHNTRSGSPEMGFKTTGPLQGANWNRVLGSKGSATHLLMLRGAGIPKSLIRELARGNKYTIVHRWGDHVAYAGLIQNRRYVASGSVLRIQSNELRKALLGVRLPHGVNEYNPAAGTLVVANRSWAGAVRAVLLAATKSNAVSGWELPLDLPADGPGGFSATWRHEEGLRTENLLAQIEADGPETDFAPYLDANGYLRYTVRVNQKITTGGPFLLAARAPGSIVVGLETEDDYVTQRTGQLGFGKGSGQDKKWAFAPTTGDGIRDLPVMDSTVTFPDVIDQGRLQAAVNTEFGLRNWPIEQWHYSLYIGGVGPAMAAPGSIHDLHVYGDEFIEDGSHPQRVVSLSGGLGHVVKPEVQAYG
ncbi:MULTISPECIES: hypothetical protein [unclassified Microbacterium]|uniref:hypothetical protein n=1 Tax=unclassified Microbacterium TaxID=2609290 RepID=UPI00300F7C88